MNRLKTVVENLLSKLGKPRKAPQPARAAKQRVPVFVELPELESEDAAGYGRSAYN